MEWMCKCLTLNTLFCFLYLLFGGDDMWTKLSIKDLKNLLEKGKKHSLLKCHLDNEISLHELENVNIRLQFDDRYRISVHKQLVTCLLYTSRCV